MVNPVGASPSKPITKKLYQDEPVQIEDTQPLAEDLVQEVPVTTVTTTTKVRNSPVKKPEFKPA